MDPEQEKAIADLRQAQLDKANLCLKDIREVKKKFKKVVDDTKRETQLLDAQQNQPKGRTRSSKTGKTPGRAIYSDGKWINKGIDDASEKFGQDEKEYLRKNISRMRKISDLKTEHLKYLVMDVLLDELRDIKSGKLESEFHQKYVSCDGDSKTDLRTEIRTSLFTNEQRDYISGLLQGAFQTTTKDHNDDIKHSEINYVEIVMLYECIARIVKHLHKFDTIHEALGHMKKRSREAAGIDEDDDD